MANLENAINALQNAGEEFERVERVIGRAVLSKMQGDFADPIETYKELGGSDPVIIAVFEAGMSEALSKIDVGLGIETLSDIGERDAGGKTVTARLGDKRAADARQAELSDALSDVDGTHFNLLKKIAPKLVDKAADR